MKPKHKTKKSVQHRNRVPVEYRMILEPCAKNEHTKCKGIVKTDPFTTFFCKCPHHKKGEENEG